MANPFDRRGARATIHRLRPRRGRAEVGELQFAFRIDNYPQLNCAYGPSVAHGAVEQVVRALADLLGDGGLLLRDGDGLVSAFVWEPAVLGSGPVDRACASFIESLSATIALLPIRCEHDTVHVSVSGAWCVPSAPSLPSDLSANSGEAMAALGRIPIPGEVPTNADPWARRYRSDMADAVNLFQALACGRAHLARQPVRRRTNPDDILYYECLLRAANSDGQDLSPSALLPALERLGLARALDHHVVSHVIDHLARDPGVTLGANISAQSATFDGFWVAITERLSRSPDVARRLVLEVTGTAQVSSISDAKAFVAGMRKLGCRIALDDLGAGHSSIQQLLSFKPEIVKIDGLFLHRASLSQQDRAAFRHLVGLATALAPVVVVEGAATEALSDIACAAGADWQQGAFLGQPTVVRTRHEDDRAAPLDPLQHFRAGREQAALRHGSGSAP